MAGQKNRSDWVPFRSIHVYLIESGLGDTIYLDALMKFIGIKREEINEHGSAAVKNRPLRVETGFDLDGRSLLNHDRDDERQRRLDEAAVKSAAFKVEAAANATAIASHVNFFLRTPTRLRLRPLASNTHPTSHPLRPPLTP